MLWVGGDGRRGHHCPASHHQPTETDIQSGTGCRGKKYTLTFTDRVDMSICKVQCIIFRRSFVIDCVYVCLDNLIIPGIQQYPDF